MKSVCDSKETMGVAVVAMLDFVGSKGWENRHGRNATGVAWGLLLWLGDHRNNFKIIRVAGKPWVRSRDHVCCLEFSHTGEIESLDLCR